MLENSEFPEFLERHRLVEKAVECVNKSNCFMIE